MSPLGIPPALTTCANSHAPRVERLKSSMMNRVTGPATAAGGWRVARKTGRTGSGGVTGTEKVWQLGPARVSDAALHTAASPGRGSSSSLSPGCGMSARTLKRRAGGTSPPRLSACGAPAKGAASSTRDAPGPGRAKPKFSALAVGFSSRTTPNSTPPMSAQGGSSGVPTVNWDSMERDMTVSAGESAGTKVFSGRGTARQSAAAVRSASSMKAVPAMPPESVRVTASRFPATGMCALIQTVRMVPRTGGGIGRVIQSTRAGPTGGRPGTGVG